MSARPAFRAFQASRTLFRRTFPQRRAQSTAAGVKAEPESGFSKFLNSPVGPKTVHFWAPVMKWGLVLAGISDFIRPVETLSLSQNLALTATGAIWTRWCLIIKPKNYFLASVNFFLFLVNGTQVGRILIHHQQLKNAGKEEKKTIAGAVEDVKAAVKQ